PPRAPGLCPWLLLRAAASGAGAANSVQGRREGRNPGLPPGRGAVGATPAGRREPTTRQATGRAARDGVRPCPLRVGSRDLAPGYARRPGLARPEPPARPAGPLQSSAATRRWARAAGTAPPRSRPRVRPDGTPGER